jgi:hypothetical protein
MSLGRATYRARQFLRMMRGSTAAIDSSQVREFLGPQLLELFECMHPAEQEHSYRVYRTLIEQGETSPELLRAALLHDAGKARRPLRLWERVAIVIAKKLLPEQAERWGADSIPPAGLRGAFSTAAWHPAWGAQMALQAGADGLTCELIRRHQDNPSGEMPDQVRNLLHKLQAVDDNQ